MFKQLTLVALISATTLLAGCVTHLSPGQEHEMSVYEAKGLAKKDKSVALAATLGVFPVMGYAYTGHPVAATLNVITWPFLGFIWGPFDCAYAAQERNFYSTREFVESEKRRSLSLLDAKLESKQLSYEQHLREQRDIEAKYSPF
jgi:hypothetical protein